MNNLINQTLNKKIAFKRLLHFENFGLLKNKIYTEFARIGLEGRTHYTRIYACERTW